MKQKSVRENELHTPQLKIKARLRLTEDEGSLIDSKQLQTPEFSEKAHLLASEENRLKIVKLPKSIDLTNSTASDSEQS